MSVGTAVGTFIISYLKQKQGTSETAITLKMVFFAC
jgi:hypothetical protein